MRLGARAVETRSDAVRKSMEVRVVQNGVRRGMDIPRTWASRMAGISSSSNTSKSSFLIRSSRLLVQCAINATISSVKV